MFEMGLGNGPSGSSRSGKSQEKIKMFQGQGQSLILSKSAKIRNSALRFTVRKFSSRRKTRDTNVHFCETQITMH